jgi:hypothetical protein
MAAGGPSYFFRHKSNQKRYQQKGFFAAQGLCPAKRTEPGLELFCPYPRRPTHAKTSYALQPHHPPLFCPFSPEAALLTLCGKTRILRLPYFCFLQIVISIEPGRTVRKREREILCNIQVAAFFSAGLVLVRRAFINLLADICFEWRS